MTKSFRPSGRCSRSAFTLIELLVTIGILVLLISILVPTINRARRQAVRTRMASDLQAISTALDAYHTDFGDYPRVEYTPGITSDTNHPEPPTGAQVLCWALIGPAGLNEPTSVTPASPTQHAMRDGADGPGFRTRCSIDSAGKQVASGRVYGSYLPADKFHMGNPELPTDTNQSVLLWTLLDSNNKPILYAPASPKHLNLAKPTTPSPTDVPTYIYQTTKTIPLQTFVWDLTDFLGDANNPPTKDSDHVVLFTRPSDGNPTTASANRVRAMLGDLDQDGWVGAGETPASTGPYVLWMAGPDGQFGPAPESNITSKDISTCDDVTNFNNP